MVMNGKWDVYAVSGRVPNAFNSRVLYSDGSETAYDKIVQRACVVFGRNALVFGVPTSTYGLLG